MYMQGSLLAYTFTLTPTDALGWTRSAVWIGIDNIF
jgi:hypothetical protein